MKLVTGNSNPKLSQAISAYLGQEITPCIIRRFADGEIFAEIQENVRGEDVFVVQSTCNPVNDNLMELLILIDALKRGSAKRINVVMPYFGYARQDRKTGARTPITAKLVADLLSTAGASRVLAFELHSEQIQGFFNIPLDHLFFSSLFTPMIGKDMRAKTMIVAPDIGGMVRVRAFAKHLDLGVAIVDKRRDRPNQSQVMHVVGDVTDAHCILLDDICDTAGTLCNAAQALMDRGAQSVQAYCAHGVLSGDAVKCIEESVLEKMILSNSIPANPSAVPSSKIQYVCLSELLGEAIARCADNRSISSLFIS